jgi:ParB-like chromosome segregation protein Spo0J
MASKTPKHEERRLERRPLDSLTPHPKQREVFCDLGDDEVQYLAEDMDRNGQLVPIEISPAGTIICGHRRVAAAKRQGWQDIECWVRYDLEEQGEAAITSRFIEDNLERRQLSHLGIARCYRQLKQIGRVGHGGEDKAGDLRDSFGERFGMSGRSLDRLAKMLETPMAVQNAYERGELTQGQILSIVKLDADIQQAIAERIAEGEKPADVAKEYLAGDKPPKQPATALTRFVKASQQFHLDFDSVVDMAEQLKATDKKALRGARRVITKLIGPPRSNGQKARPGKKKRKHREEIK